MLFIHCISSFSALNREVDSIFRMYYKSNTIDDKSSKHTPEQEELQRVH